MVNSPIRSIAIVGNQAFSLKNFRGPLIEELVRHSIRVYALAPDYQDNTRAEVIALGAEPVDFVLQRTGLHPVRDMHTMFCLMGILRRLKVDAILTYFAKPVIYGTLAAYMARVPRRFGMIEGTGYVFSDAHGESKFTRRLIRKLVVLLYRGSLAHIHRLILLNPDDVRLFLGRRMVDPQKILLVPGIGVDLEYFSPSAVQDEPITFMLMARMLIDKGIREYVMAAREVKKTYPTARFVLLGGLDVNPRALQEQEILCWVRENIIDWAGHVSDVRPYLHQCSVFVLPSYYMEGLPRSILEAMAIGRPIITTDWIGCRETVVPGLNGYLVPIRDVGALTKAMLRFLENPGLVRTMGRASRRLAEERYDIRRINDLIITAMNMASHQVMLSEISLAGHHVDTMANVED